MISPMKLLSLLALALAPALSFGQLVVYTFGDINGNPSREAIFTDPGISSGLVGSGTGMAESFGQVRFSGFTYDTPPRSIFENTVYMGSTEDFAVLNSNYWNFTIMPTDGNLMNLSEISVATARGGGGVSGTFGWSIRSSVDNFSSTLDVVTVGTGAAFENFVSSPREQETGLLNAALGPEYQNLTGPVEFRVYAWASEPFNGWFSRVDTFQVSGSVEVIPEPSVISFFALSGLILGLVVRRTRK